MDKRKKNRRTRGARFLILQPNRQTAEGLQPNRYKDIYTGDAKTYWAILGEDGRQLKDFAAVQEYLEEEANIQDENEEE